MDEEQQFLFDVNGYIVLEDVSRQFSLCFLPRCSCSPADDAVVPRARRY